MSQVKLTQLVGYSLTSKNRKLERQPEPEPELKREFTPKPSRGRYNKRGGYRGRGCNYNKSGLNTRPVKEFRRGEVEDEEPLIGIGEVDRLVEQVYEFIKDKNLPPVTAADVFPQSKEELWNNLKIVEFVNATDQFFLVLGGSPRDNYVLKPRLAPQGVDQELDPRYVVLIAGWDTYESADRITDYYQEKYRLDSYIQRIVILGVKASPNDMWFNHPPILKKWIRSAVIRYTNKLKAESTEVAIRAIEVLDTRFQRELLESLFNDKVHSSQYRVTWVISIIDYFRKFIKIESMLDPSMGWGDRLIGAMKMNVNYTGFDPNTALHPGYERMIQDFAPQGFNYSHTAIGFEDAIITDKVDFILTSPPYGDVEVYSNEETQSIIKFKDNWMLGFYEPYLIKAWNALRDGGILVLQIGDNMNFKMVDYTIQFFKQFDDCIYWGQFLTYAKVGKYGNLHLVYRKSGKGENDSI